MLGIGLAIAAAMGFGINAVFMRKSLAHIGPAKATFVSLIASVLVAGVITLITDFRPLVTASLATIGLFAAVGLLNFTMGRYLIFVSVRYIGASRATPVYSAAPFFSIIFAVILAGERVTPLIVLGALSIVAGLFLLLRSY